MSSLTKEEKLERMREMYRLRYLEHWSLQMIADKYDLTRERVRQILGNTGKINKEQK